MLSVEEIVNISLIEEGQFLMGIDFLTDVLGLDWDKLFLLFKTCVQQYARRKPVVEDKSVTGSGNGLFIMPEGTLMVRAVRYDILPTYPKTAFEDFGQLNYEYDIHTRQLRVIPPMTSLRVNYSREYTFSDSAPYKFSEYMASYEKEFVTTLQVTPKKETLVISKDGLTMKEVGIEKRMVDQGNDIQVPVKLIKLSGDLGKGYYNPETKELEVNFKRGIASDLVVSCTPKYPYVNELSAGEYVFKDFFKANFLEAVASLRNQINQEDLHDIDFSNDDLYSRVRLLKLKVESQLGKTIDWGAIAPI